MKRVKIADLKNNLSRHLAHVRAGGDLVVLDRETPVARVVPFTGHGPAGRLGRERDAYWTSDRLEDLERRGIVSRPEPAPVATAVWLKALRPIKRPKGAPSAVGLLLEMRRESTR